MNDYVIAGAGPVGCLQGIILRQLGKPVVIYEKRSDMRLQSKSEGRSINLVVTSRGIAALSEVGLWGKVKKISVPVMGRMIHGLQGEQTYQPYGKDDSECNYSISRGELNKLLINEAEHAGAKIFFDRILVGSADDNRLHFRSSDGSSSEKVAYGYLFGADGANSSARQLVGGKERFIPFESGYKEFLMPADSEGNYAFKKNALHIWPRGKHMLMALPNRGGSFTMTLYLPLTGSETSFEALNEKTKVDDFFDRYYPDAVPLIPNLSDEFLSRPQGRLGTVYCSSWCSPQISDQHIVLLGDAAHAVVPFFGQGMNCGFEDCSYLKHFFDEEKSWEKAFIRYDCFQRPNGNAIAEMALENFVEMTEKVGDPKFLLKKQVDGALEKKFPRLYRTRYAMVVYTLIPYALAQTAGVIQQEILHELCCHLKAIEQLDWKKAEKLIAEKFTPFVRKHNIVWR